MRGSSSLVSSSYDKPENQDQTSGKILEKNLSLEFWRIARCRWFESISLDQKFIATSSSDVITEWMLDAIHINEFSTVLEPSAGSGGMRDVIKKRAKSVVSVELNKPLYKELDDGNSINADFLRLTSDDIGYFSHIVMCPPRRSDDHIEHALTFLEPNGKLIALVQEQNIGSTNENYFELPNVFEFQDQPIKCGVIIHV